MAKVQQSAITRLSPGEGEKLWVLGDQLAFKSDGDRDGVTIFVATIPPGGGPPPHVHYLQEEVHFVLEGSFSFLSGDTWLDAEAGTFLLIPRGVAHTFRNRGSAPGRLLVTNTLPGAHERWFRHVGVPFTDSATFRPPTEPPDMVDLVSSAAQADIHFLARDGSETDSAHG